MKFAKRSKIHRKSGVRLANDGHPSISCESVVAQTSLSIPMSRL